MDRQMDRIARAIMCVALQGYNLRSCYQQQTATFYGQRRRHNNIQPHTKIAYILTVYRIKIH